MQRIGELNRTSSSASAICAEGFKPTKGEGIQARSCCPVRAKGLLAQDFCELYYAPVLEMDTNAWVSLFGQAIPRMINEQLFNSHTLIH
jgi:hypothetical protein